MVSQVYLRETEESVEEEFKLPIHKKKTRTMEVFCKVQEETQQKMFEIIHQMQENSVKKIKIIIWDLQEIDPQEEKEKGKMIQ